MIKQFVIAKGAKGEPKKLALVGANSSRALVANPASDSPDPEALSLPLSNVFEFDAAAFERLLGEWLVSDGEPSGWKTLKPFAYA